MYFSYTKPIARVHNLPVHCIRVTRTGLRFLAPDGARPHRFSYSESRHLPFLEMNTSPAGLASPPVLYFCRDAHNESVLINSKYSITTPDITDSTMEPPWETCSTTVADCFIEKGSNVPILLRAHRMAIDAVKILLTRSFALALVLKSSGLIDHVMLDDKVRDAHTGSTVRPLCPYLRNSAENGAVPRCYTLFYCSKKGCSYHDPPKLDSTLESLGLRD